MALQEDIYKYFDTDSDLHVLFVFDTAGDKQMDLEGLTWRENFVFEVFTGAWFQAKVNLDTIWKDKKVVLLFPHQVSPLGNREAEVKFQLMDMLTANKEFHEQDYLSFMQQYNLPKTLGKFVARHIQELQMSASLKLFSPFFSDGSFNEDIGMRGFITRYIKQSATVIGTWDELIIQVLILGRAVNKNKLVDFLNRIKKNPNAQEAFSNKWMAAFGEPFSSGSEKSITKAAEVLKYNIITQHLAESAMDDYHTRRVGDGVTMQNINRIWEQAVNNTRTRDDFKMAIEELGGAIREENLIRWYGPGAAYTFISKSMCWPVIEALLKSEVTTEPARTKQKLLEMASGFNGDPELEGVIRFVSLIADYYERHADMGSLKLNTPDEYVSRYVEKYSLQDRTYRDAIASLANVGIGVPVYDSLIAAKEVLDRDYDKFVNALNIEWMACVRAKGGFESVHLTRQQDFYSKFVAPEQRKQVVIISDALRYEVAMEVMELLSKKNLRFDIRYEQALAMLPTETKYCKQSLLPHDRLELLNDGYQVDLKVDGKRLVSLSDRAAQLLKYNDRAVCFKFSALSSLSKDALREKLTNMSLIYVFHDDIDDAGHDGTAVKFAETCHKAAVELSQLIAAIMGSANTYHLTLTADHGFIFNDKTFGEKDKLNVEEETIERKSRYYLTDSDASFIGIDKYRLRDVSAMDEEIFVAVPQGSTRLAAPAGGYMFAHGGASLQEMVIPVFSFSYDKHDEQRTPVGVFVQETGALRMASSKLKFTLLQTFPVNENYVKREVTCALYLRDEVVTPAVRVTLDSTEQSLDRRATKMELTLNREVDASILQLRIYDVKDPLNALVKENVTNSTMIQTDF